LTRAHDGFLALIAPDLTWRGERSPELPAVARQADLVWEVASPAGVPGILHIELQTHPDDEMGERLAEYAIRLWRRDHLPVRSAVVFLRPTPLTPGSPYVIQWDGRELLRYDFDVVRLWDIPQEQVLSLPQHELWPLAGLAADVTVDSTIAAAERIAQAALPLAERSELLGALALLAGLRVPRGAVLTALRRSLMLQDIIRESTFAQDLIEEGKVEGQRQMARLALQGRYGPLADELVAAVNAADDATLRALVEHLTTDTMSDVRARLGLT
jgi:predicted transposase YdaD